MDKPDRRTLAQLAQEALDVQDACNLVAVVRSWALSLQRLNTLFGGMNTGMLNTHVISQAWADKVASLCRVQGSIDPVMRAFEECERIAKSGT